MSGKAKRAARRVGLRQRVLLLAAVILVPELSGAQQQADDGRVSDLVERAVDAHQRDEFATCAALLLEAYELTRAPDLLRNAAVCQFDGGNEELARSSLRQLLELGPAAPQALRLEAKALLARMSPPEAAVPPQRDGPKSPDPVSPPAPVQASETAQPLAPPWTFDESQRSSASSGSLPTWFLVGAVLGAGAGTAFALASRSSWKRAQRACPALAVCPDDRGSELSSQAIQRGNFATVSFAASALAGAGALYFWLSSDDDGHVEGAGLGPLPSGMGLQLRGTL